MQIQLVPVEQTKENAKLLASWRSDAHARSMSVHTHLMDEEEFWQLFSTRYFELGDLPPVFALLDGTPVAFVGFNKAKEATSAYISIVVSPDSRGKGVGYRVILQILEYAKGKGYNKLYADIRPQNTASIRIFEKAGF
ncbi:MAG: GNAT family N-acetyltransferase, partial [Chlamydiales bacterium]|nr:GNAT family N-acetyltransferase [Chlamydiales bacterium]